MINREENKWRIENKGRFYDQFLNHSILLNAGTASIFISLVSAFWKDGNPAINILLLVGALCFANNAANAVNSYFKRMEANDRLPVHPASIEAKRLAKKSMEGFVLTVRLFAVFAIFIQIFQFNFVKEFIHSVLVCMWL